MKKKQKIILISLVLSIVVLIWGTIHYQKIYSFDNVFDQMYSSRVEESYFLIPDTGLLGNMKELNGVTNENENLYISDGIFEAKYKQNELAKNQALKIMFYKNYNQIEFYSIWTYSANSKNTYDEAIWLQYTYDMATNTLTKNNIILKSDEDFKHMDGIKDVDTIESFLKKRNLTWEELDNMQEEFFYDKFLTDFFNANKWYTKFSKDNLGDVTIVSEKGDDLKNSDNDAN